jgi:hypothetical protein
MSFGHTNIKIHFAQLLRLHNLVINANTAFAILLALSLVLVGNLEVSLSMT